MRPGFSPRPAAAASDWRIRNSVTVSVTGRLSHTQVWRSGSILSLPRSRTLDLSSTGAGAVARLRPAQHGLDPLDQKPLREGFADEIVGAHFEAEQLVDLLVLGGEEDHRQLGPLAEAAQQLHAVHARHLDIENGEVRRILGEDRQARLRRRCRSGSYSLPPRAPCASEVRMLRSSSTSAMVGIVGGPCGVLAGRGGSGLTQIMAAWGRIAQPVNSAMQQISLWRK